MSPSTTTHLPPLPEKKRRVIFLLMLVTFAIAVPSMVLYAIGYRFDFSKSVYDFKAVGGMYINSPIEDATISVNGKQVEDMRIFRSAAYIQNLEAGVHEVYVERDGLHTWVKELPIFEHLVTEAESFNLPSVPQIRLLTEWSNEAGVGVVFDEATSTHFAFASTTNLLERAASTTATTTLRENLEYVYIASRFASSSEEAALLEQYEQQRSNRFNFATDTVAQLATTSATTTKYTRDSMLFKVEEEVFVTWTGSESNIPYYYCLTNKGPIVTPELYGEHVFNQLVAQTPTTTNFSKTATFNQRYCRDTIRIDRLWQTAHWFDFMPGDGNLVLMLLSDGLYVVEIDDRAWQNTQLLYPGKNLEVLLDGGRIFVKDGDYYLEVFTEIAQPQ